MNNSISLTDILR